MRERIRQGYALVRREPEYRSASEHSDHPSWNGAAGYDKGAAQGRLGHLGDAPPALGDLNKSGNGQKPGDNEKPHPYGQERLRIFPMLIIAKFLSKPILNKS